MAPDLKYVKARLGDTLGFSENDLARLYGVAVGRPLDARLVSLAPDAAAIVDRILGDIEAARAGYRQIALNEDQMAAIADTLRNYRFHSLVSLLAADGSVAWKLSADDAQYVAFRSADVVAMDFELSEVLRARLKRMVIWPEPSPPSDDRAFRDHVAELLLYLIELAGIL
ncbi:MAG TPA: hypothetical protein VMT34_11980 [Aggregatilineales bacterium]|nr:hypothetical protein [Aggregatilineales bacterium]